MYYVVVVLYHAMYVGVCIYPFFDIVYTIEFDIEDLYQKKTHKPISITRHWLFKFKHNTLFVGYHASLLNGEHFHVVC